MGNPLRQLDPGLIDSVQELEWIARYMGKGIQLGKHKSGKLGTGMEFNQFRAYSQGDDLRLLDWKMYAKTGKYFVRLSTLQVDQTLNIHIDNSRSMDYEEESRSKLQVAKLITATLSYIMTQQSDHFCWESGVLQFPKGSGLKHWKRSLLSLFKLQSDSIVHDHTSQSEGIHLWITDLYQDINEIRKNINLYLGKNRELIIFHLIGKKEENLEFSGNSKFIDLETSEEVLLDSGSYKDIYSRQLNHHLRQVRGLCDEQGIMYHKVYLHSDLRDVLRDFISRYNYLSAT